MNQSVITKKERGVLAGSSNTALRLVSAIFGIAALLTLLYLGRVAFFITTSVIFFACLMEFIALVRQAPKESPIYRLYFGKRTLFIAGTLYLALLFTLNATLTIKPGEIRVLFLFLGTWSFDTAAFFVGSNWGKHKITPGISPNKSLEGLIAGIFTVTVIGLFLPDSIFPVNAILYKIAWVGVIVTGAFTGDLIESALKRSLGAKDSSRIIPGHGGFLDRFDSLVLTSTLSYLFFRLII